MNSNETFYAGIFSDASYTTLADNVSDNIVALSLNGESEVTVKITAAVTEEEGTVSKTSVSLSTTKLSGSVTITNQEIEETDEETTYEEETETETETEAKAVQTGDDTPAAGFLGIMLAAFFQQPVIKKSEAIRKSTTSFSKQS
ncbi:MAG: hypothetical protein LUG99_03480 [Lachnospiraceae bacterium]|nr:hypothetical protein [Lachnospiraceae bacterium]